jgi:hypothetical protein
MHTHAGFAHGASNLPSFSWDTEDLSKDGVPLLKIDFPDGAFDYAELKSMSETSCLFNGYLRKEPKSFVVMSGGCPFTNSFLVSNRY